MEVEGVDYSERIDLPQVLAELAAREWEALELIKGDVCQWLSGVLLLHITPSTFLSTLDTGVHLCSLVSRIQQAAVEGSQRGDRYSFKVPVEPINCNVKANGGSFHARDNTSNFLSWCRGLGVEEAVMFESEGLVLHRDEKRVILCLLDVARFAEKVGIPPPQLVKMEKEIDMLEKLESQNNPTTNKSDTCRNTDTRHSNTESETEMSISPALSPRPPPHDRAARKYVSRIPVRRSTRRKSLKACSVRSGAFTPQKRGRESEEEGEGPVTPSHKRLRSGSRGQSAMRPEGVKKEEVGKKEEEKPKESVDENVMRRMAECTCQNRIEVTNCGKGKFIVRGASGRKMTIYARVSRC